MNQQNRGKMTYDSMQFVANKRMAKGVTINASYTWVPRWTEEGANTTTGIGNAYVDEVSLLPNKAPYFSQRKHRITASGVWELPWFRNQRSLAGYVLGGWSVAPAFVYQSGQPWDMPGNVDLAPGVNLKRRRAAGQEGGAVHLRRQAVRRRSGTPRPASTTCCRSRPPTAAREPYFLIREAFQRRTAMFRYDEFRRPSYWQVDVNFAKTTRITERTRMQVRLEAFNLFNSPMYDERNYNQTTDVGGLRPHQPEHHGAVELPAVRPARLPLRILRTRPSGRVDRSGDDIRGTRSHDLVPRIMYRPLPFSSRRICAHNRTVRVLALIACLGLAAGWSAAPPRAVTWADVAPLHAALDARGVKAASFDAFVASTHADSLRRVREGDWDHLVFYALQSTHFTPLPPIEPALSAKALVEGLEPAARGAFLAGRPGAEPPIPPAVARRVAALLGAVDAPAPDSRVAFFQSLLHSTAPDRRTREAAVHREYRRAMRFIYEKEFVAQRAGIEAVEKLYRTRGLSTDTAVEAGYVVYSGLGIVRALDPARRIRRVLIIGPGLDLAPRTGLLEAGPPESYQPWAIIDALLALGLSDAGDLEVVGADINPRVVAHLARSRQVPPVLTLVSGLGESEAVTLSAGYRDYFAQLGRAIGTIAPAAARSQTASGHLHKTVRVGAKAAAALTAAPLDIVTERLDQPEFDLVVATNILPYFDDVQLMLALSNISRMLAPGGIFLHNEARPVLGGITDALGLPLEQSRQVVIATVRGAAPLADSIWLHRRTP